MSTNHIDVVKRVDAAYPHLLIHNTKSACGEFLQRVVAEPEMRAEHWGLLTKPNPGDDNNPQGYTFPNGIKCSYDYVALPNGERVDIIGSGGGYPDFQGGPSWAPAAEHEWRPSDVYIDVSGWPLFISDAPTDAVVSPIEVGFGWFCMMTALAEWPDEAKANMDWILKNINPSSFRVMLAVEGESHGSPDVWRDAGVFIHKDWDNRYRKMQEWIKSFGKKLHATFYGGRNQTPTESSRNEFHGRVIRQTDWDVVRSFECANEFKVNKWTPAEVRSMGRDIRSKLPAGFKLSLSSPDAAHGGMGANPTNEQMQESADELYGGDDNAGATEMTIHTMRGDPHNKWANPSSFNFLYPKLKKINNEPPGPGSSAGGMYTTGADVERDLSATKNAGWPLYMGHSEWSVWNGHLPQEYYNGWREIRMIWDLPNMVECAAVMKSYSGDSDMAHQPHPYEQDKVSQLRGLLEDDYGYAGRLVDGGIIDWSEQTFNDYYNGMTWEDSVTKHRAEWCAALGIPVH